MITETEKTVKNQLKSGVVLSYISNTVSIVKHLHLPIITFPHVFLNPVRKCDLFYGKRINPNESNS